MGPWHDLEARSHTHRRTPMDWDAEHILLCTVRCVSGTVELVMNCEPSFDYHRVPAKWEYSAQAYGEAIARAATTPDAHPTLRLTTNLRLGLESHQARARTRLTEGDNVFVALSWSKHPPPHTFEEAAEKMWQTSECGASGSPWRLPGPSLAHTCSQRADVERTLLFTDRGPAGGDDHLAAGDASGGTQLGLPLCVDSGLDLALWGLYTSASSAKPTTSSIHRRRVRRQRWRTASAAGDVGVGGSEPHRGGVGSPFRLRRRAACPDRQRRLRPNAADIWGTMLDSVYLHANRASSSQTPVAVSSTGTGGQQALEGTHAGSGRCAANRSTSPPARSCVGGAGPRCRLAALKGVEVLPQHGGKSPRRSRPTSWPRVWTTAGC